MTRGRRDNPSLDDRCQRTVSIPIRIVDGRLESFYGGEMPRLRRGTIPALQDLTALSLNHVYRLVSEAFERHRRSHAGNVFSEVYYRVKDAWRPLDAIRAEKEAELEVLLKRAPKGKDEPCQK